ncbi:MAG TPA: PAC2 family protein [Actinomycetota bacterium]|nr:PAC2 family protein [Actinomycetota bacterium]
MDYVRFVERPQLTRPAMVCAFAGWNDGGEAATTAATYLRDRWEASKFASLDPEEFFDFQMTRPTVSLVEGTSRKIDWPANDFFRASLPERDVIVFIGIEPNIRWRTFCGAIVDTAKELGVEVLVTLGAFLADVPHTRPAPSTASSGDPSLLKRLGSVPSRYEGPTGITGVLHDTAGRVGLPSISIWAAVPHYLPSGPNPRAALSLVQKVAVALDVPIPTDTLALAGESWEPQISAMIEENADLAAYVRRLEETADEREELIEIPSGEALAEELERFLREQRKEGDR